MYEKLKPTLRSFNIHLYFFFKLRYQNAYGTYCDLGFAHLFVCLRYFYFHKHTRCVSLQYLIKVQLSGTYTYVISFLLAWITVVTIVAAAATITTII